MTMSEIIIKAEHLSKSFPERAGRLDAVRDVSFTLSRGEVLGIVGESGSGKSTVARMLTGMLTPTEGRVEVLDGPCFVAGEKRKQCRWGKNENRGKRQKIQMVFQMPTESFDPRHTLGDGIGEVLRNSGMSRKESRKKVEELLQRCGLPEEFADRYPHQASGGQCQRAAIARALAGKPEILICDEATSALDVTMQAQILELLIDLKEKEGMSQILICHDLALVQKLCDRVLVMYRGQIVEQGTTEEVIRYPKQDYTRRLVEAAY